MQMAATAFRPSPPGDASFPKMQNDVDYPNDDQCRFKQLFSSARTT